MADVNLKGKPTDACRNVLHSLVHSHFKCLTCWEWHYYAALEVHRTTTQNNRVPALTCVCGIGCTIWKYHYVCVCGWFRLGMTCTKENTFGICNLSPPFSFSFSLFSHKPHVELMQCVCMSLLFYHKYRKLTWISHVYIFICDFYVVLEQCAPSVSHVTKWFTCEFLAVLRWMHN